MNHVQTKINTDGTICIDYYNSELYLSDIANTIKNIIEYIESTNNEVRRFPFYVANCENCSISILTNRDYLDEIKCQQCGHVFCSFPNSNSMNQILQKKVNDMLGYKLYKCDGYNAYMLAFIPEGVDHSNLGEIMKGFGFCAEHCDGVIYENLLEIGQMKGWLTKGCKVGFGKMELGENDFIFDDRIPRVESCARFITKYSYDQIKTVSIHVPVEIKEKTKTNIKDQIEKLVAEGKMDEAMKLMEEL